MNIHEILESNYIVGSNEDFRLLVTVNGAYIQIWVETGYGDFEAHEALSLSSADGDIDLYSVPFAGIVDRALQRADEYIVDEMTDEDDEDEDNPEYGSVFPVD